MKWMFVLSLLLSLTAIAQEASELAVSGDATPANTIRLDDSCKACFPQNKERLCTRGLGPGHSTESFASFKCTGTTCEWGNFSITDAFTITCTNRKGVTSLRLIDPKTNSQFTIQGSSVPKSVNDDLEAWTKANMKKLGDVTKVSVIVPNTDASSSTAVVVPEKKESWFKRLFKRKKHNNASTPTASVDNSQLCAKLGELEPYSAVDFLKKDPTNCYGLLYDSVSRSYPWKYMNETIGGKTIRQAIGFCKSDCAYRACCGGSDCQKDGKGEQLVVVNGQWYKAPTGTNPSWANAILAAPSLCPAPVVANQTEGSGSSSEQNIEKTEKDKSVVKTPVVEQWTWAPSFPVRYKNTSCDNGMELCFGLATGSVSGPQYITCEVNDVLNACPSDIKIGTNCGKVDSSVVAP